MCLVDRCDGNTYEWFDSTFVVYTFLVINIFLDYNNILNCVFVNVFDFYTYGRFVFNEIWVTSQYYDIFSVKENHSCGEIFDVTYG